MDWALVLGRHHRHTRMQTNFALTVQRRQVLLVVESDHDVASFRADQTLKGGGWIVDRLLAASRCQLFVPFGPHLLDLAYIVFQELAKPLFSHSLLVCECVCVCAHACAHVCVCAHACLRACVYVYRACLIYRLQRRTTHDARGTTHGAQRRTTHGALTTNYPITTTHNTNQPLYYSLPWCFR